MNYFVNLSFNEVKVQPFSMTPARNFSRMYIHKFLAKVFLFFRVDPGKLWPMFSGGHIICGLSSCHVCPTAGSQRCPCCRVQPWDHSSHWQLPVSIYLPSFAFMSSVLKNFPIKLFAPYILRSKWQSIIICTTLYLKHIESVESFIIKCLKENKNKLSVFMISYYEVTTALIKYQLDHLECY